MNMNIEHLKLRSAVVKAIRRFFDERGYTEMHTPRLVGLPGQEPYLEPFETSVSSPSCGTSLASDRACALCPVPCALITSPEYAMKRLLANGMDKIYDLGPCFRNDEPWDGTHDPEFLMLEWYRKNADLNSLMKETEELIKSVGSDLASRFSLLASPIPRVTCEQAWKSATGTDLASLIGDREAMAKLVASRNQSVDPSDTWDDLYFKIFLSEIEPKLAEKGCFLHRYPISMASLAKPCEDDSRFAERVELYLGGMELANGFHELSDADAQRARFIEEQELRRSLGKKVWPLDEGFLRDLPKMGDAVGIALGVDRLAMLLAGASSINDVIPFSARERFGNSELK
jgi:lysyl-tRNA synthetase class 2